MTSAVDTTEEHNHSPGQAAVAVIGGLFRTMPISNCLQGRGAIVPQTEEEAKKEDDRPVSYWRPDSDDDGGMVDFS